MSNSYVKENLAHIEARIQAACNRCGRSRDEVLLIAVSKTKPVSMIREAIQAGIRDFGENKVQELCEKYEEIHGTEENGEAIRPPPTTKIRRPSREKNSGKRLCFMVHILPGGQAPAQGLAAGLVPNREQQLLDHLPHRVLGPFLQGAPLLRGQRHLL